MSISPTPPDTGYALSYQVLEFYFNNGLMLQFSLEDQGIDWENPNLFVGYFTFDPGTMAVGNIYELFKEWYPDMTMPQDLKLNYIHLAQQTLWNLPCNIEYAQRMSINSVRVVEMAPTD
jgi:hypothetical protein